MGNSDHGTACMRVGGDDGGLGPWHCIYVYLFPSAIPMSLRRVGTAGDWVGAVWDLVKSWKWCAHHVGVDEMFGLTVRVEEGCSLRGCLTHNKQPRSRSLQ